MSPKYFTPGLAGVRSVDVGVDYGVCEREDEEDVGHAGVHGGHRALTVNHEPGG